MGQRQRRLSKGKDVSPRRVGDQESERKVGGGPEGTLRVSVVDGVASHRSFMLSSSCSQMVLSR